jgi:UTP:GlnB (protein PII) uridylyltransferase
MLLKHYGGTLVAMESVVSFGRIPVSFLDAAKNRGLNREVVTGLVDTAPIGWLDGTSEADLIEDLVLIAPELDAASMRVRVRETGRDWELSVVTTDHPGVLATSCRILAACGLTITGARVASWTERSIALQRFRVIPVVMPLSGEPDWPTITLNLRAALLSSTTHDDSPMQGSLPNGWTLELLEDLTVGRVAMRFTAPDAPGLLADITQFLSDVGADVRSADVRSEDGIAIDDFVLTCTAPAAADHLRSLVNHGLATSAARSYWSEWSIEDSSP